MLMCMRTNIVLNDQLLKQAGTYSQATTKRALVEEALQYFVTSRKEEDRRKNYSIRYAKHVERMKNIKINVSPLELLRQDRLGNRS